MEQEILNRLAMQDEELKKIYKSTERTRMYMKWTGIISIAVIVIPLIGIMFAIPAFLNSIPDVTSLGL